MLARPTTSRAWCEEAPTLTERARGNAGTIGQKARCESHLQDSDPIHLLPLGFLQSRGGVEKGNGPWDPRQSLLVRLYRQHWLGRFAGENECRATCLIDSSPSLLLHGGPKSWALPLRSLRRGDDRGRSFSRPHRWAEPWDRPGRGDIPRRTVPQPAHGNWDGGCGWPTAARVAHGAGNCGASGGWTRPEA